MDTETPRLEYPSKGSMEFKHNGFQNRGCTRAPRTRLQSLLFPESQTGKRKIKQRLEDAKSTVKKTWIAAQLAVYQIPFKSNATVADLLGILKASVQDGKCDRQPRELEELEKELRGSYEERKRVYDIAVTKLRREEFDKLGSPSKEANYDEKQFMAKYFLNARGGPDRSKTLVPMALPGLHSRMGIHAAAERIPGLITQSGGTGDSRTLVIGWDISAVSKKVSDIDLEAAKARKEALDAAQKLKMAKLEAFVASLRRKGSSKKELDFEDARGQYIIECEQISSGWDAEHLSLRICLTGSNDWPLRLVGLFDLGVIQGIMHIGPKPQDLPHSELVSSGEDSDERDGTPVQVEEFCYGRRIEKRKMGSQAGKGSSAKNKKRVKTISNTTCKSSRLHLLWRGRETGEGMIELDYYRLHTGHIEFKDNECTRFVGAINVPCIGKDVPVQGYKVSTLGGPISDAWSNYSESVYERERVGRWH